MPFSALATFILQAWVLLGVAVVLRLLLRARISAASRYRMLFVMIACLPLLAAATLIEVGPSAPPEAESASVDATGFSVDLASPSMPRKRALPIEVPGWLADILVAVWAAVAIGGACFSVFARLSIARALRRMEPCRDPAWLVALETSVTRYGIRRPRLLDGGRRPPFTAGFLGGTIVVPAAHEGWSREKREAVLFHEAAHVKRRDVPMMAFIDLTAALAWCVPFMPYVVGALAEDREEACDEAVVEKGAKRSDYAALILELTLNRASFPLRGAPGMVGRTRTEERIVKIIDRSRRGGESRILGKAAAAALLVACLLFGATGTLSGVFAVDSADETGNRAVPADDRIGGELGTNLPTASPLVGAWRVTQGFGARKHPVTDEPYLHTGIDLANGRAGDPVSATMEGKVTHAGYEKGSGNYVVVENGRLQVRFSKLQELRTAAGARVRVGTVIGTVGATGVATGPHLHYEIRLDGIAVDPASPLKAGGALFGGLGDE